MKNYCQRKSTFQAKVAVGLYGILTSLFLLSAYQAAAQNVIPPSGDPSRIEPDFSPFSIPKSSSEIEIPGKKDLALPENIPDSEFLLKAIELDGVTAIDQEKLKTLFRDQLNQRIDLRTLYEIVNSITAYYRNQGYILSQAILPEQVIDPEATVRISVVEGFISGVNVNTEDEKALSRIEKVMTNILRSKPLHAKDLERYLLLLNDIPGNSVTATLAPSATPKAADLTLNVTVDFREYSVKVDNRGNDFIGPYRYTASTAMNALSRLQNSLTLSVVSTLNQELTYGLVQHMLPIGMEGLQFNQSISLVKSQPGGDLEPLEIDSQTTNIDLGIVYPYLRSRRKNISFDGLLSIQDTETTSLLDAETASPDGTEDKLRSIRLGMTYDNLDNHRGLNLVEVGINQGIDGLGAGGESKQGAKTDYTSLTLYAARLQALTSNWSAYTAINGQYSSDVLFSSEQFGVGGKDFGSAFDASEIVGDSGYAGRVELRYSSRPAWDWLEGYSAYLFLDGGRVERNAPTADEEKTESLSSSGLGIRFDLLKNWDGYLEFAVPTSNSVASEGNDDGRVFFSMKNSF